MQVHILLAEDDENLRDILSHLLIAFGYKVTPVPDGFEALNVFEPGLHHALITDYDMPHVNGVELVREIRGRDPRLPVVLATGNVPEHELLDLLKHPKFVAMRKPFMVDSIVKALRKLFESGPFEKDRQYGRDSYRFDVTIKAQVRNHGEALVRSLSLGGCFLAGAPKVTIGDVLSIRFNNISLQAQVAWRRDAEAPGKPQGVGMRFLEATEESQRLLVAYLAEELIGRRGHGWLRV